MEFENVYFILLDKFYVAEFRGKGVALYIIAVNNFIVLKYYSTM